MRKSVTYLCNNKVEEPLSSSSDGDVHGAKSGRRDLRNENPADWSPTPLEESSEEEDADQRDITEWRDWFACGWWIEASVEADNEHADTLCNGSPQQGLATTKGIGCSDQENEAGQHLDEAVDTSSEKTSASADDTQVSEDGWCVVVDGVGTGHLLANHEHDRDDGTLAVGWDGPHLSLQIHEGGTGNQLSLVLKLLGHFLQLHADVWVISWEVAESDQDGSGLLPVILLCEETWRLVAEEDTDDQDDSWKHLKGQWDLPLSATSCVEKRTIVDPKREHDTGRDVQLVYTSQATTDRSRSVLRDVKRSQHGGSSDTQTSDETTHIDGSNVSIRSSLNDNTKDGCDTSRDQ